MHVPIVLLKHVAKAFLNLYGGGVAGEFVFGIAEEVMIAWKVDADSKARKAELEQIAQATTAGLKAAVAEAVEQAFSDLAERDRLAVTSYLIQIPAAIRRTFRRSNDPTGKTVPTGFSLSTAQDLEPLLPSRIPRFQPGDRPLKGVNRELVELLGVGGFGEVWKAVNYELPSRRPVALKFCLDPASQDRLLRHEMLLLDRVMQLGDHPGIVSLVNTYTGTDTPCLEYEYVDGGELTALIRQFHSRGGISPKNAAKIIERLARTVGHFHRLDPPVVHRDLKPANILVTTDAAGKLGLKVADFGIGGIAAGREIERFQTSRSHGGQSHSISRGSYSPLYASPEQVRGGDPDPRDDVHALGVIWYQLLSGDLTQGAPTGLDWVEDLKERKMSQDGITVLASCFSTRLDRRPANAGILAEKIAAILPSIEGTAVLPPVNGTDSSEIVDVPPKVEGGTKLPSVKSTRVLPPPGVEILHLKAKGAAATGYEVPEGFVVLANSRAKLTPAKSTHQYLLDLRNKLVEQHVFLEQDGHWVFTVDHRFESPSSAAGVLLGRSANGRIEWKSQDGTTLKEIQEKATNEGLSSRE